MERYLIITAIVICGLAGTHSASKNTPKPFEVSSVDKLDKISRECWVKVYSDYKGNKGVFEGGKVRAPSGLAALLTFASNPLNLVGLQIANSLHYNYDDIKNVYQCQRLIKASELNAELLKLKTNDKAENDELKLKLIPEFQEVILAAAEKAKCFSDCKGFVKDKTHSKSSGNSPITVDIKKLDKLDVSMWLKTLKEYYNEYHDSKGTFAGFAGDRNIKSNFLSLSYIAKLTETNAHADLAKNIPQCQQLITSVRVTDDFINAKPDPLSKNWSNHRDRYLPKLLTEIFKAADKAKCFAQCYDPQGKKISQSEKYS